MRRGGMRHAPPGCRMMRPAGPGESSRIGFLHLAEGSRREQPSDGISVWGAGPGGSSRIGFLHLAEGSRGRRVGSTSEILFLGMRRVCAGHRSSKLLPATILARQGLSNLYLRPLETKGFSSQRAANLKQIRLKRGYAPGYAPYIYIYVSSDISAKSSLSGRPAARHGATC